ncbi:hypothetical protein SAMD00019534_057300 [Acytostelium subglobosum LB1]|uniref:hypothetical protein n=1 Tax=Acytostelium subglobosum LB1 TaxID=1410327 RepID=UPI000644A417|nr:hypothetical protein SAMD00019534_057300 [Acytostelium subglobosum LB1]GAM22555.1 hypothetical protein SAMD00019534_057300 [Acytostelium subglobosum LB1]|eukprot:XP_012754675.1 hypothetical protein SAMD00019534_057300 [Acytostelium subglobosum LB1]
MGGLEDLPQQRSTNKKQQQQTQQQQFVKGDDCKASCVELIRYLRRDNDNFRDVFLTIGPWNIIKNKLIPLVLTCSDDTPLVVQLLRILVKLTMPIPPESNELATQVHYLLEYKASFINEDFLMMLLSVMREPMIRLFTSASTTTTTATTPEAKAIKKIEEIDSSIIELILSLIRNILQIQDPDSGTGVMVSEKEHLQEEFILLLDKVKIMDLFLTLSQTIKENRLFRANSIFSLLLLEIFANILRNEQPSEVFQSVQFEQGDDKITEDERKQRMKTDPLLQLQKKERQLKALNHSASNPSFSTRFIGTYKSLDARGKANIHNHGLPTADGAANLKPLTINPKSMQATMVASIQPKVIGRVKGSAQRSKSSARLRRVLKDWSEQFLDGCYNVLMEIIVLEFAKDKSVLEMDRQNFIAITHYFTGFTLQLLQSNNSNIASLAAEQQQQHQRIIGSLSATLSLSNFNFIFACIDSYLGVRNSRYVSYVSLEKTVSTLCVMVELLYYMSVSDNSEYIKVSQKMQSNIYYNRDVFLRKVIDLLKRYDPKLHSSSMLIDLCNLSYTTIHMVKRFCERQQGITVKKKVQRRSKSVQDEHDVDGEGEGEGEDEDTEMAEDAEDAKSAETTMSFFSFLLDFANVSVITNFCNLLGNYHMNTDKTNMQLVSMIKSMISELDVEPMFYRLSIFYIFNNFMNDPILAKDPNAIELLELARTVVGNFFKAAEESQGMFLQLLVQKSASACIKSANDILNDPRDSLNERSRTKKSSSAKRRGGKKDEDEELSSDGEAHMDSDADDDKITHGNNQPDEEDEEAGKDTFSSDEEILGNKVVGLQSKLKVNRFKRLVKKILKHSDGDAILMWIKDHLISATVVRGKETLKGKFTRHVFRPSVLEAAYVKNRHVKKLFKVFRFKSVDGHFTIPESKLYSVSYLAHLHQFIQDVEGAVMDKKALAEDGDEEEEVEEEIEEEEEVVREDQTAASEDEESDEDSEEPSDEEPRKRNVKAKVITAPKKGGAVSSKQKTKPIVSSEEESETSPVKVPAKASTKTLTKATAKPAVKASTSTTKTNGVEKKKLPPARTVSSNTSDESSEEEVEAREDIPTTKHVNTKSTTKSKQSTATAPAPPPPAAQKQSRLKKRKDMEEDAAPPIPVEQLQPPKPAQKLDIKRLRSLVESSKKERESREEARED